MIYINGQAVGVNTVKKNIEHNQLICYGEQPNSWSVGKNALNVTESTSGYVTYDSTNKEFTVIAPFKALINSWVYQYAGAYNLANGQLYINNDLVASYDSKTVAEGSKNGALTLVELSVGDVIYVSTPNDHGYPAQRIKIYRVSDTIFNFLPEPVLFEAPEVNE